MDARGLYYLIYILDIWEIWVIWVIWEIWEIWDIQDTRYDIQYTRYQDTHRERSPRVRGRGRYIDIETDKERSGAVVWLRSEVLGS